MTAHSKRTAPRTVSEWTKRTDVKTKTRRTQWWIRMDFVLEFVQVI